MLVGSSWFTEMAITGQEHFGSCPSSHVQGFAPGHEMNILFTPIVAEVLASNGENSDSAQMLLTSQQDLLSFLPCQECLWP